MIDTVIFDLDDTLYDQLQPFKKAFQLNFSHLSHLPVEKLYIASRKYSDAMADHSKPGATSLLELHIYRTIHAFKEFGIEVSREEAIAFQLAYQKEQDHIVLFPEMESLLDLLCERNMQLGLLTNGPYQHQQLKIRQLELHRWIPANHIFISEEIGSAKPDTAAFLAVEKKLCLEKERTVYIGDSYHHDIVGARQAGWNAIWFNHRRNPVHLSAVFANKIIHSPKDLLNDPIFLKHNHV